MNNFDIYSTEDFEKFITDGEEKNVLKIRVHNALRRSGIQCIDSFAKESPYFFPLMWDIGEKFLKIIEEKHAKARCYIGMEPEKLSEEEIYDATMYKRKNYGRLTPDKMNDAIRKLSHKYGRASY